MIICLVLFGLLLQGSPVFAQQGGCEVKVANLSGSYSGGCKNGLAHGKGIAQGTDHYEGQFMKGVPDGKGTYTWSNGIYYKGQWKEGKREGQGKLVKGDTVVSGFWRDDVYMGEKAIPPYKIIRTLSYLHYSFTKVNKSDNNIRLRFFRGGVENADMEGADLIYSSGTEYQSSSYIGIQNPKFPIDIKVKFRASNYFHTSEHDVIFEFTINEPGTWDVAISY